MKVEGEGRIMNDYCYSDLNDWMEPITKMETTKSRKDDDISNSNF